MMSVLSNISTIDRSNISREEVESISSETIHKFQQVSHLYIMNASDRKYIMLTRKI